MLQCFFCVSLEIKKFIIDEVLIGFGIKIIPTIFFRNDERKFEIFYRHLSFILNFINE